MKKSLLTLAIAGAFAMPIASQAGSLTVANQDITLSGGLAGGWFDNTDTSQNKAMTTDALLDLSSEAKAGGMGFDLGVGVLAAPSLASSSNTLNTAVTGFPTGVQYGWLTIMPTDGLSIQAGTLATNVGYEVVPSYANGNMLRGLVWSKQPAYYNGVRVTYSTGNMSVYVEGNNDPINPTNPAFGNVSSNGQAIGASATMGTVDGSISYFNDEDTGGLLDIIASSKVGSVKVAANLDWITLSDKQKKLNPAGADDNAFGIALYASVPMGDMASLPMRLEYVNDGSSGIYSLGGVNYKNSAITFTITPTYNFTKSTFVRAELAYVSTDKKVPQYVDDKGAMTDSNLVVGLGGGILF